MTEPSKPRPAVTEVEPEPETRAEEAKRLVASIEAHHQEFMRRIRERQRRGEIP